MKASLITQDEFKQLETEWNLLIDASGMENFFMSWKWLSIWWHFFGSDLEWLMIGIWENERLIGIAPLCIKKIRYLWGVAFREVQFMGSGITCSEYLDFIWLPNRNKQVFNILFCFLFNHYRNWDLVRLKDIFIGSKTVAFFESKRAIIGNPTICPFIALPNSFDEYLNRISKKSRSNVRKKARVLERAICIEYGIADESNRLKVFNELKDLHIRRWQAKCENPIFCNDTFCSFHAEIIHQFPPENVELSYIKDRNTGSYLAIQYAYIFKKKVYLYQQAINHDYHKYSPGYVLLAYNIKRYINSRYKELDFLRGDEDYKFHWTKDFRSNIEATIFNKKKFKNRLIRQLYLLKMKSIR